jgi:hypothetical protein
MKSNCARLVWMLVLVLVVVGCRAAAPTLTPTPNPTAPVEILASGPVDVMGVWLVPLTAGAGQAHLEFGQDSYTIKGISVNAKGVMIASGSYEVAGGELRWAEGDCITTKGEVVRCVGVYQAYVVRRGGKSVQLRLKTVEDKAFDRSTTFNNVSLSRAEP